MPVGAAGEREIGNTAAANGLENSLEIGTAEKTIDAEFHGRAG